MRRENRLKCDFLYNRDSSCLATPRAALSTLQRHSHTNILVTVVAGEHPVGYYHVRKQNDLPEVVVVVSVAARMLLSLLSHKTVTAIDLQILNVETSSWWDPHGPVKLSAPSSIPSSSWRSDKNVETLFGVRCWEQGLSLFVIGEPTAIRPGCYSPPLRTIVKEVSGRDDICCFGFGQRI